jgi:Arc/MetJ family transcription regulator
MTDMDDLLIAMIIAGIGLSIAYLRDELVLRQEFKAAEREKELALRERHITRPRREYTAMLRQPSTLSWPLQTNPFQLVRVFVRALRIFLQEGNIQRLVSYVTNRLQRLQADR